MLLQSYALFVFSPKIEIELFTGLIEKFSIIES